MKVALVHDDFMQWGGAERVVEAMAEVWPDAPIYTIAYNDRVLPPNFPKERLRTSLLHKPLLKKLFYPHFFFLDPLFFELMNFNEFDVVISSSTRFSKSVVTQPKTLHISYINSPPRFLWPVSTYFGPRHYAQGFIQKLPFIARPLAQLCINPLLTLLRMHDYTAAQRIDYLIGNSKNVAKRINKFYERDADVIYPSVELERFEVNNQQLAVNNKQFDKGYFLIVSRLSKHKRVDLAIEAFNELGWKLKIIGTGSDGDYFKKIANPNIEFFDYLPDQDVVEYIRHCKAFLYPQEEDFGITAIEAQAMGKPVVAYKAGGALETIVDGETGIFFDAQTKESLIAALKKCNEMVFDEQKIKQNAQRFSRERFKEEMKKYVEEKFEYRNSKY